MAGLVHVVARGAYWQEAGREYFRPLSVDGKSWNVSDTSALDPDAAAALAGVIAAATHPAAAVCRVAGSGRWAGLGHKPFPSGDGMPRLFVELTEAELLATLAGGMDRAVYTRIQRAIGAGVPAPEAFADPLPVRCRVSMRGRHGAARGGGAAAPAVSAPAAAVSAPAAAAPAPIIRPNGEKYHPRLLDGRTDVEMVRQTHDAGRSVLLFGSPGTGKTALLEAAFADRGFHYVAGSGDTVVDDFVGGFVPEPGGSFRWVNGPLLLAMMDGRPLIVDEISLPDPRVMAVVYSVMDGRGELPVTQNPLLGVIKARPGFGVHGACNPDAPGSDMSEALLSRMTLQIEYATDYALAQTLGAPARLVTAARNLDKRRREGEVSWSPQMRELLAFVTVAKLFGAEVAHRNLVSSAPAMDRPIVADVLSRSVGSPVTTLRLGEEE